MKNFESISKGGVDEKLIFRVCYIMIQNNLNYAITILDKLESTAYTCYSLKVNAYSQRKDQLDKAVEIIDLIEKEYPKMIKKRVYIPIMTAFLEWFPEKAFPFLVKISILFRLHFDDIDQFFLIDHDLIDMDVLLDIVSNNEIILNRSLFPNCKPFTLQAYESHNLKKIGITKMETKKLMTNFKNEYLKDKRYDREIKNMDKFCENKGYNMFIDGANIMFYYKRRVNFRSYERLKHIYDTVTKMGHNPLVILHKRHRKFSTFGKGKQEEVTKILKSMRVYYTPYNMNDDYFFIWQALRTPNSLVVSNDRLTDHIFKISEEDIYSNTLLRWIKNSIITFKTFEKPDNIQLTLKFPDEVSYQAQKSNGQWYIPVGNKEWLKLPS